MIILLLMLDSDVWLPDNAAQRRLAVSNSTFWQLAREFAVDRTCPRINQFTAHPQEATIARALAPASSVHSDTERPAVLERSGEPIETHTMRMKARIDFAIGREWYGRRFATVELVFANLRHNKCGTVLPQPHPRPMW